MKKYKNKRTGDIVIGGPYSYVLSQQCVLPSNLIEGSPDWKEPLFTTEDGVDLFERGDEIYVVKRGECKLFENYHGRGIGAWLNGWYADKNGLTSDKFEQKARMEFETIYLAFSTEEKAMEYISENMKKFSISDIERIVGDRHFIKKDLLLNLLKTTWIERT